VKRLERRAADATVVTTPQGDYTSRPTITRDDIPDALSAPVAYEEGTALPNAGVSLEGNDYLVVATPVTDSGMTMYFFYSRAGVEQGLTDLARITWRLWLVVIVAAALVGNALARRTLRPVSRASMAARSLAEGLLDTRLPVEREDEFGAWAASFNEMAEALQDKISELTETRDRERQFTSDVSHELRTPLTALVTSASMLEERLEEMDAETRWMSERMIREARRVRALVDELLEISRLQSGPEVVRMSAVDLGRLVENIITSQGWAEIVDFRPRSAVVSTDKARAERIVVNLISNSVEHGRKNPRVRVGKNANTAFVEVRDDGPGIAPDHVAHIFERFYKADLSRGGGSGLGLSIAAENARLVGATIEVSSDPGKGATFTLTLPVDGPKDDLV
jgi:two-component system sensor histidine kinase MtrB